MEWADFSPEMKCRECGTYQQKLPDPESNKIWHIERHRESCSRYKNNLKLIDKANGNA